MESKRVCCPVYGKREGKRQIKSPPCRGLPVIYYLPKAQDFPPCRANCQVDQRRNGRHDEAVLPPFTLRDIASAKVDRGAAIAVMREGDRHIGEDTEDNGDQKGRCTDADTDGNECCIEGADACCDTGEGVVDVGVEKQDDEAGNEPTKAERGNRRARAVGDPRDDA